MKRLTALILAILLLLTVCPAFADVAEEIKTGETLTHEELVERALSETGTFVVYGNTSRIANAVDAFASMYDIPYASTNMKDKDIYENIRSAEGSQVPDMVMIQDGAQMTNAMAEGLVLNFVPLTMKDALDEADRQPALIQQFINKLFIYNNLGEDVPAIQNVWELTAPEMRGRVLFKNPKNEQVNMNFLIMCTQPEWAEKLANAYKAWKGEDIDLGGYPNAGYKWVAEFLTNVTFGGSDTSIAEDVSQEDAAGQIGLFVLNKLRSRAVLSENLIVAPYDAAANGYELEPFSGFMYPMYAMVTSKASRPYTAMLFIEYIMTKEGFRHWGKNLGAYSPNPALSAPKNDLSIDVWKQTLVVEDAQYILEHQDVKEFVLQYCPE